MNFELPSDSSDLSTALREAEPQAPKQIKPLLIQAAQTLELLRIVANDVADTLETAAALRIGQMDSESRIDEVTRQMRLHFMEGAAALREPIAYASTRWGGENSV